MKHQRILVAALAAVLLTAVSLSAAPWRNLTDTTNGATPAPILQWFDYGVGNPVSSPKEFYDNAKPITIPSYPWGGGAGTNAIKGVVNNITYGIGSTIVGFKINAQVSNDTYDCTAELNGTNGQNDHGQSARNINRQDEEHMVDVRLAASFADRAPAGNLPLTPPFGAESNIYSINCNAYAWYSYASDTPPAPNQSGGYWVPVWNMTGSGVSDPSKGTPDVIEYGDTHYRTLEFGVYSPIAPGTSTYNVIVDSFNNGSDIFFNRTSSLKISDYPDALARDDGTDFPQGAGTASDVSVFYRAPAPGSLTYNINVPIADHTYAPGGDIENEMLSFKVTAGAEEALQWQSIRLVPSSSGDDAADISSVDIWVDLDADGIVDATDTLLVGDTYAADNAAKTFVFTSPYTIPAGSTVAGIVAYRMRPTAPPGASYKCQINNSTAVGVLSGVTVPNYGLPLSSCWKYIETAKLTFSPNGAIPSHFWYPTADPHNEMLDFWVEPGTTEGVSWNTITLQAQSPGLGNDHTDVLAVRVWLDYNHNEQVDVPLDLLLGTGIYAVDEGSVTITFATPVACNLGTMWEPLVSYTMNNASPVGGQYRFSVIGATGTGMISGLPATIVGLPLDSRTKTVTPAPIKIGAAKQLTVGEPFLLEGKIVTANMFSTMNMAWIEEPDRSAGICVYMTTPPGEPLNVGDRVSVFGSCSIPDATELLLNPTEGAIHGAGTALEPLAMNGKATGGAAFGGQPGLFDKYLFPGPVYSHGLNNVGMLVRIWGGVQGHNPTAYGSTFWIEDGSGLVDGFDFSDGTDARGIAVLLPSGMAWPTGNVAVTGVLRSVRNPEGGAVRLVVPRDATDVVSF